MLENWQFVKIDLHVWKETNIREKRSTLEIRWLYVQTDKRDKPVCHRQKRQTCMSKETWMCNERQTCVNWYLYQRFWTWFANRQKRPTCMSKEAYVYDERQTYVNWNVYERFIDSICKQPKETYRYVKRALPVWWNTGICELRCIREVRWLYLQTDKRDLHVSQKRPTCMMKCRHVWIEM